MTKRKSVIWIIISVYMVLVVCATLFVPVQAYVVSANGVSGEMDAEAHAEYGYYPLWAVAGFNEHEKRLAQEAVVRGEGAVYTQVFLRIKVSAWIVQYVVLTVGFASMLWQVRRHYS